MDKEGREKILLGDAACDLTTKQANQPIDNDTRHVTSLYDIFNQLIKEPTRITLGNSSMISHIATTFARNIINSGLHDVSMSDHHLVYCIRKFNGAVEKGHKVIKTRKMKNFNELAFLSDVAGINWEQMLTETDDINVLLNHWTSTFSLIIDKHAPL